MVRRALPAVLALVALLADLAGVHGLAFLVLLAAIPAAFVLVLDTYGEVAVARSGGLRPLIAAGGLALLVLSAALRSPAVVGGVPRVAVSAVGLALFALASAFVVRRPQPRAVTVIVETEEEYAEAA
jgi:hypothetical protein